VKRLAIILTLIVAAAGGWAWGSPYWTVWQLRKAADARDVAAISARVDYPAVRESLKAQLRSRLVNGAGLDALSAVLARRFAEPVIDAAVTPEGMQAIFATAAAGKAVSRRPPGAPKAEDLQLHREAIDRFSLRGEAAGSGALVFRLRGLRWMLTEIRLPAGAGL
jgi:hypothetical protein